MGYGMLPIDMLTMAHIFDAPDEWGLENTSFEEVHDKLHLPSGFCVKHIAVDYMRRCYLIMLESPTFPEVPAGSLIPQVLPLMAQKDGRVMIAELRTEILDGPGYWRGNE